MDIYNIGNPSVYGENISQVQVTAYDTAFEKVIDSVKLNYTSSVDLQNFVLPTEWANYFIGKIEFEMKYGSFTIDNIALNTAPTPVPGAAVLLFSGLLGLVGLRRRQIV